MCCMYSHYRAGIAPLFAAFSDKKSSIWLPQEQLLCLCPVQIPHKPVLLIIVRQVLIFLTHKVTSATTYICNTLRNCTKEIIYSAL